MPNTYSQIYLHNVWSPKYREALIRPNFEIEVYKYITGVVKELGHLLIRINGMPDHIHVLIRLKPHIAPSKLVQLVKQNSSKWINQQGFLNQEFKWQRGGGIFSVNPSHVDKVIKYIDNQKEHHRQLSFKEEYVKLLGENHIEYDEQYLLDFFENVY
ncbi:MAG: IS200/IS605 family transposase [Bacteroidetes bacterium]|nr:MAG: IS200/IS605 family transposase [Bacteroidota bacterium]